MNHLCSMQRRDNGRFDYTYNGVAYGYCRPYEPIPEDGRIMPAEVAQRENEKMKPFIGNFHDDGHATAEEACECYKRYLLDTRLHLVAEEPVNASSQHKCEVCGKFTACNATVGPYRLFTLCLEHQTREQVEKLLKVGESWES